jgi:hypothetical protein
MRSAAMKPSLPSLNERPMPARSDTGYSTNSYGSNAPLLSQASDMGQSSPVPPMPQMDRNADYFGGSGGGRPMPQGLPGRPYSPMSQGRASPAPPRSLRSPLAPVDTNYSNGRVSPSPQLISPLPSDPRGPYPGSRDPRDPPYPNRGQNQSRMGDPTFSPYNNRGPAMGPSYEMSPVEMTPSDNRPYHYPSNSNGSNGSNDYRPPQMPNILRAGSPAQGPPMNNSASPPTSRAGTAPPNNPRAGIPATLQSAIQRREASQPLPRGPGGMYSQQRSATAPLRQPGWGPGPTDRSNTASPGARGPYNGF